MSTNTSKNLKVDDLGPGDELITEAGHLHWVRSVDEAGVTLEDVDGETKHIGRSEIEQQDRNWSLESCAPEQEGSIWKLITQLIRAVKDQGDCEPYFVMEQERGGGYNPITTFDYKVVSTEEGINIVCKNGSKTPEVPYEKGSDTE